MRKKIGLTDRFGNDVYDGDILDFVGFIVGRVYWNENAQEWYLKELTKRKEGIDVSLQDKINRFKEYYGHR
jgi:myo-inositol catabolism protein IolC